MPIYEYQCDACAHRLERLQKVSDAPLVKCPECHEEKLNKLVSAPAFRLKGGGWYETDFKTGDKKNVVSADSKTAKPADKPSGKSDGGTAKSSSAGSQSKTDAKSSGKTSAA